MFDRLLSRVLAWSERLLRIRWIAEAKAVVDADAEAGGSPAGRGAGLPRPLRPAVRAHPRRRPHRLGLRRPGDAGGGRRRRGGPRARASSRSSRPGWRASSPSAGRSRSLGLVGAAFGASIFYDALDESMNRVMPGGGQRNPILRRLLGIGGRRPAGPRRRGRARHRASPWSPIARTLSPASARSLVAMLRPVAHHRAAGAGARRHLSLGAHPAARPGRHPAAGRRHGRRHLAGVRGLRHRRATARPAAGRLRRLRLAARAA